MQASSAVLKPSTRTAPSSTNVPSAPRVTLPSDLSGSLKYLDSAQLQRLHAAVNEEIERRNQTASKGKTVAAAAPGMPPQDKSLAYRDKKIKEFDEIPEGRANLIRASFRAGIKPTSIARTFRISQSLVNRVLSSAEKPKK
jgi:DNA invertase Pin-like site-specific DNA recombinase